MAKGTCAAIGCLESARAREWCNLHYQRWFKYGDADWQAPTEAERFWSKIEVSSTGCWLWTSTLNNRGYARFVRARRRGFVLAHRYSYTQFVGPIPEGLVLDHLCEVKHCVNPDHLEPVTNYENLRRAGHRG